MIDPDAARPRHPTITLGELKEFAERHGIGDDVTIGMEHHVVERDGTVSTIEDEAVGARITLYSRGSGMLVICAAQPMG